MFLRVTTYLGIVAETLSILVHDEILDRPGGILCKAGPHDRDSAAPSRTHADNGEYSLGHCRQDKGYPQLSATFFSGKRLVFCSFSLVP